jgi:hypothetical protein
MNKLNPDKIDVVVICQACRAPLWEMRILSRLGDKVGSTEFKPLADGLPTRPKDIIPCPKCGKDFATAQQGKVRFKLWDPITQQIFTP